MKNLSILSILFVLLLCSACKEEEEICTCEELIGKRWYYNSVDRDAITQDDCEYFEDFFLDWDGTVSFRRYGAGFDNVFFDSPLSYEREGCEFTFRKLNDESNAHDQYKSYDDFINPSCRDVVSSFGDRIFNGSFFVYRFNAGDCGTLNHNELSISYVDEKPE